MRIAAVRRHRAPHQLSKSQWKNRLCSERDAISTRLDLPFQFEYFAPHKDDPDLAERFKSGNINDPQELRFLFLLIGNTCDEARAFRHIKLAAIARLLDGAIYGLEQSNYFMLFLCMRSILEHVGMIDRYIRDIEECKQNEGILGIRRVVLKRLYGTRTSWIKLNEGISNIKNAKEYENKEPKDLTVNIQADQLLSGIDGLSKRVEGVRFAYNFFSEFAHPNIGANFCVTTKYENRKVEKGKRIQRTETISTRGTPMIFSEVKESITVAGNIVFSVFEKFPELETKLIEIEKRARTETQSLFRESLPQGGEVSVFLQNELCPCRSEQKFKRCCGSIKSGT